MTDYTLNDLRGDLAETIKSLRTGKDGMDVAKAKAIGDLAQTMINSAKVEVDMLRTVGRGRMVPSGFIPITHQDTLDQQEEQSGQQPQIAGPRPKPHIRNPVGSGPRGSL